MVKYYIIKEMLSGSHTVLCIMKFNDPNTALLYARYLDGKDPMCLMFKHSVAEYKDVSINQFPINRVGELISRFFINNKPLFGKNYTEIGAQVMNNIEKVAKVITDNPSSALMGLRTHLETIFSKRDIDFSFDPVPHFRIKVHEGIILIVNKKYVDNPKTIIGEIAIDYEG